MLIFNFLFIYISLELHVHQNIYVPLNVYDNLIWSLLTLAWAPAKNFVCGQAQNAPPPPPPTHTHKEKEGFRTRLAMLIVNEVSSIILQRKYGAICQYYNNYICKGVFKGGGFRVLNPAPKFSDFQNTC